VLDVGAFGSGVLFIDDVIGTGIRYKSFPLAETYFEEDAHGRINRLHRKFEYTAAQAMSMFDPARLSQKIHQAAEKRRWKSSGSCTSSRRTTRTTRGRCCTRSTASGSGRATSSSACATRERGRVSHVPLRGRALRDGPREVYGRSPAMKVLRPSRA
jgi:hypothetical protein